MNSLDANTRDSKSKGDVRSLRLAGNIPGIVYGGPEQNQKITILKKTVKSLLDKGSFLSNIITLNLDGKPQNVLPREVSYNVLSDEPTHIDFLRIVPGVKIRIEVPVEFINHETSPGLKRGGVLNIVRRKIELKCPSEKIPSVITLDLDGVDIGESFKISAVKLEEGVTPTITGRDFVIATLAAPTVMKEPEKPAEEAAAEEGAAEEGKEAAPAAADGDKKDGDDKKASEEKK
ncbi:50S ribosomal protein L25/general stress protein Ctc [Pelagibacteraceae bacterium]|nr:50S ribosomal protein L25/general stress protein Ctc [Candidatus Pelagibacter sp.]MDC1248453.1 50S ribosomal protein L25/general stress protein Ctc [Pelagibacteraceae bacterium]